MFFEVELLRMYQCLLKFWTETGCRFLSDICNTPVEGLDKWEGLQGSLLLSFSNQLEEHRQRAGNCEWVRGCVLPCNISVSHFLACQGRNLAWRYSNEQQAKIGNGLVVQFLVTAVQWIDEGNHLDQFHYLVGQELMILTCKCLCILCRYSEWTCICLQYKQEEVYINYFFKKKKILMDM